MELAKSAITVTEQDIAALEHDVGSPLPETYRSFLRETNGGSVTSGGFFNFDSHRGHDASGIVAFYRLLPEGIIRTVRQAIKNLSDYLPEGLLPIGYDALGNQILIGLAEPHRGKIFFRYHDLGNDEPWDNVFFVADSFAEFVSSFYSDI